MTDAPDFSGVAKSYAESRPGYPAALFDWLASIVAHHDVAWDAATGSGQAAIGLAGHFRHVIGTDTSEEQILHARPHPRVAYQVGPAEQSGLADRSVDLVVAASALHWFDLPRFYAEVVRVTRSGGVVAAWTYHVAHVEPPFEAALRPFYRDVVGPYFAAGARLVDDRYRAIRLPGEAILAAAFSVSVQWTVAQMLDFVRTWSGVQAYIQATGRDPVTDLSPTLEEVWGSAQAVREVRWPLYLRASRV
jgi:SAM-dependent methyltransferase